MALSVSPEARLWAKAHSCSSLQGPSHLPADVWILSQTQGIRDVVGAFFFLSSFAFFGRRQYWISNFPFHLAYTITFSQIQLRQWFSTGMTLPPRDMWRHLEAFALSQLGGRGRRVACRGQRPGVSAQPGPATENRPAPESTGPRRKTLVTGHLAKSSEDQSRPWPVNSGSSYCYQSPGRRDQNHRHQIPWQIVPGSKSPKDLPCFHGSRSKDHGLLPHVPPPPGVASRIQEVGRGAGSGERGQPLQRGDQGLPPPRLRTQHCFQHRAATSNFTKNH